MSSTITKEDQLIEAENPETSSVKASVYLDYFRAASWPLVFGTVCLHFIFQSFSVGTNLWLSEWTSNNATSSNSTSTYGQTFYLSVYGGLGFCQAIAILFASLVMAMGTVKSSRVLHFQTSSEY